MTQKLQSDLERFFRVYQNDVSEVLKKQLPPKVAGPVERALDEEFELFRVSLINRLTEEMPD